MAHISILHLLSHQMSSATLNGPLFPPVFTFWVHRGSLSGCVESETAGPQGQPGPSQPHPSGWDSPLCSPGGGRLGIVDKEVTKVSADDNHPESWVSTRDTCLSLTGHDSVFSPITDNFSYSPLLGSDLFCDGVMVSTSSEWRRGREKEHKFENFKRR